MMQNGNKFQRLIAGITVFFFTCSNAFAAYSPAEQNPLLGRPVLMDATTCIKKYGENFCSCVELDGGGTGCFYKRPAAGFYTLERCEEIWGAGQCECNSENVCQLKPEGSEGKPVGCSGQIYIFPGASEDCHPEGVRTAWRDCCEEPDKESNSCSFKNLAKLLGWDDAAIALAQAVGMHYAKKELANMAGQMAVQNAIETGAFDFATSMVGSIFGSGAPTIAHQGGQMVIQYGAETFATQSAEMAAQYIASAFMAAFSFVSWAYTIYQMYNMYTEMTKCTAAEKILGCKRAKGVCHEVGTRCTLKIFGACFQEKKVFCCFDTVLAKIVHEQGRPQIGMDWGSAKSPNCRGFYMNEFMQIDFTKIDFSEYVDDLTRQMLSSDKMEEKVRNIVEKYASEMGDNE